MTPHDGWWQQQTQPPGPNGQSQLHMSCAGGQGDWRQLLEAFWAELEQATKDVSACDRMEVQAALDAALGPLIFPAQVTIKMCQLTYTTPALRSDSQ